MGLTPTYLEASLVTNAFFLLQKKTVISQPHSSLETCEFQQNLAIVFFVLMGTFVCLSWATQTSGNDTLCRLHVYFWPVVSLGENVSEKIGQVF